MEDFITTEYNFELQKLEKQIDEQKKSVSPFGEGAMMENTGPKAMQAPLRPEDPEMTEELDEKQRQLRIQKQNNRKSSRPRRRPISY